jgi:hypothetical protein
MANASNMSTPVTRSELQKAVEQLATKADLQKAIEQLATKADLERWGGVLLARMDQMFQQLQIDFVHHINALHESMRTMLRGQDEKYADLPGRVSRLESTVFTPQPV